VGGKRAESVVSQEVGSAPAGLPKRSQINLTPIGVFKESKATFGGRLLRHPSVLSGNWNCRRDEEENLEGAGYLGRGKPISKVL
jgi:hypothetical protein